MTSTMFHLAGVTVNAVLGGLDRVAEAIARELGLHDAPKAEQRPAPPEA